MIRAFAVNENFSKRVPLMQRQAGRLFFSPNDLADFAACRHAITLGLKNLDHPIERRSVSDELVMLQKRGYDHENAYLEALRDSGLEVHLVAKQRFDQAQVETIKALQSGVDIVAQAAFESEHFRGYADFLRRVESPSSLGPFSYEVIDTKLSSQSKARHLIQLIQYAEMLAEVQSQYPAQIYVALGNGNLESFNTVDYRFYVGGLRERLIRFSTERPQTKPEKCDHCSVCPWTSHCEAQWVAEDNLNQVARITKSQIKRLRNAGVHTLEALATSDLNPIVTPSVVELRNQARLQLKKRVDGRDIVEIRSQAFEPGKGFTQLPKPDQGDLYFDMEGYPYEKGGLEYLFGVVYSDAGDWKFKAFWGHDRVAEKKAFEDFVDFVFERLRTFPNLHIYHYANYERQALRDLMSMHATREGEVDQLLREHRLVDLYLVVRDAIQSSEPRYSIKNLETFYMKDARNADVKNAGASIVFYERWRTDKDPKWLNDIEKYNYEDCISTQRLHEWLLKLRKDWLDAHSLDSFWRGEHVVIEDQKPQRESSAERLEIADQRNRLRERYGALLKSEQSLDSSTKGLRLLWQLLDFFWREAKPSWWRRFDRQSKTTEELTDELDVLASLTLVESFMPKPEAQSLVYQYLYVPQEHKLSAGDRVADIMTLKGLGVITELNEDAGWVNVKVSKRSFKNNWPDGLPKQLSVSREESFSHESLDKAVLRVADHVIDSYEHKQHHRYHALFSLVTQVPPKINGLDQGSALAAGDHLIDNITELTARLDQSYLVIQGPPGTGKTYTGARVIINLLRLGKRIGISALSHHAIVNLVNAVVDAAVASKFDFLGARKGDGAVVIKSNRFVSEVKTTEDALDDRYQLVAGTAWLFADSAADQQFDYLFIDEAGQTSLANLVAMGTAAKNIVLIGDQMQLGQPLQGAHPDPSGKSALEYALQDHATVPTHLGILLDRSYRMHPNICRFISEVVYEGRLRSAPGTERQRLDIPLNKIMNFPSSGIVFDPVHHEGCAQSSHEEAERIRAIIGALCMGTYSDAEGCSFPIQTSNIMVVAPYNAQVKCIKQAIGDAVRVGTVDRFQGQESEIVIVSMTTSSGEDMPRDAAFLLDKRRLNVAISRAKCLAIVIANPRLTELSCTTPEQMALVNTLSRVAEHVLKV